MRAEWRLSTSGPLLVELFGQPGAGKTTLMRAAVEGSKSDGKARLGASWKEQTAFTKTIYFARAILDGPCLARALKLATGARLFHRDSLSRLIRLLIKSHWIRSQTGRLLIKEAHLQDLWSIFYSAGEMDPDPHLIAPLIHCLYQGVEARVVLVEVDQQDAFERIRARTHGKSRLDRHAEEELRKQLVVSAELPYKLAEAARLAGLKVELLDASLPIETNVGRLRTVLKELEKSRSNPDKQMAL